MTRSVFVIFFLSELLIWLYHFLSFGYSENTIATSLLHFFSFLKTRQFHNIRIVFCFHKLAKIKDV